MKRTIAAILVAVCAALAAVQSNGQAPSNPPPAQNAPKRVKTKVDGFDLAPDKASANQIGGASRGEGSKTLLYAPHKARVYTLRPNFAWKGDPTATYTFRIQDTTGTFSWNREVTGTTLVYPPDAPPLNPGGTYLWKVAPESPLLGPPPPASIMVVLGGADRAQIDAGLSQIQGPDSDTARAKFFFDQRLWYDSVMAYSDLIAKNPDQASLYQMRGTLYDQVAAAGPLADADFAHVN
ncbi:MAG TPA: DUF928 domain-containing protein [Terracidiphilus sp.]|nr:DUF928 domain-containing protein [Terracidiphilus sp.]